MKYEQPNMDIIEFTTDDVVTASSLTSNSAGTDEGYDPVKDLGW